MIPGDTSRKKKLCVNKIGAKPINRLSLPTSSRSVGVFPYNVDAPEMVQPKYHGHDLDVCNIIEPFRCNVPRIYIIGDYP